MDHNILDYYVETWISSIKNVTIPTATVTLITSELELIKSIFHILYSQYFAELKKIQKQQSQQIPLGNSNWLLLPCISHLVKLEAFKSLIQKCQEAMLPNNKYFVKLSLRSAKDSLCLKKYEHLIQNDLKNKYSNYKQQSYRLALIVQYPLQALQQLMTSQRIVDDIDAHLKQHPQQPLKIHFRPWLQIPHSLQFRIFVNKRELTAISSYYKMQLYPYLSKYKQQIQYQILNFFEDSIKNKLSLESSVMDIGFIVDSKEQVLTQTDVEECLKDKRYKIIVIQANPFGKVSGGALFSWQEKVLYDGPLQFRLSHEQHIL